jgi:hypothetical protein
MTWVRQQAYTFENGRIDEVQKLALEIKTETQEV